MEQSKREACGLSDKKGARMPPKKLSPGQKAPTSGQYRPIGGGGREITAVKGNRLPPTQPGESGYKLVDPTKHK